MKLRHFSALDVVTAVAFLVASGTLHAWAQQSTSTRPTVGLTSADDSPVLLEGGQVITEPGKEPLELDVLIRGTTIVAVGNDLQVPAGTERRDASGKFIYAGLIDAMHEVALPDNSAADVSGYWNKNVSPQYRAAWIATDALADESKLRGQGITTRLVAPKDGIIKGSSCAVLLVDSKHPQRLLRPDVFQHVTLTVPRGKSRESYPDSPMGATALVRQAFYDAAWYRDAMRIFERSTQLSRPEPNVALDILAQAMESGTIVLDAANERMAIRASDVANEFTLKILVRGSGLEYRALPEIAQSRCAMLLPVDFPEAPSTASAAVIRETPLVDWMHWHLAPENPMRLHQAGVEFCLTTDGLDDPGQFLKQVRVAVERGLDSSAALASLTTIPARLLGIDDRVGKVQSGMFANLVITDAELLSDDAKVLETWIAGERFQIADYTTPEDDSLIGTYEVSLPTSNQPITATLKLSKKDKSLAGKFEWTPEQPEAAADDQHEVTAETENSDDNASESDKKDDKPLVADLKKVVRQRDRLTATVELSSLGEDFATGISQLTLLTIEESATEPVIIASLMSPDGTSRSLSLKRSAEPTLSDKSVKEDETDSDEDQPPSSSAPSIELVYPLGAYGVTAPPQQPEDVLFRGATVWTCGDQGILDGGDVLVHNGKIVEVGMGLVASKSAVIVNATGKHITPGIIDCHSHVATDGGVNESGQTITAEVRIGDFIDNSNINLYRQLAGGVTTANILHGSANPIGGQSQVIKFRWGESMRHMKFDEAPPGIKFALGENVKRSTNRYPNTRMGVEQILRDQFLAARQYEAAMKSWQSGKRDSLPPRRDLQLDALVEIQQGKRWVHCHSYRQDEIVATLDVLEEFNIRIGTLQHILEGYKVADRILAHGAMASSFADWWAYKYEVFDAIPFNGVLMHDVGVVVSFNSDDAELARHLNTEAAKATKYGGVPEQEALKFVTLNPAKQLRIDHRVGSIEAGKDADLVVWSGRPLSTTSRCEQTWIDGSLYFSIKSDQELRQRDARTKATLVQLAVESKPKSEKRNPKDVESKPKETPEAERWVRYDIYCGASQKQGDDE